MLLASSLLSMYLYLLTLNLLWEISYAGWHSSTVKVPAGKPTGVHPFFQNFATIWWLQEELQLFSALWRCRRTKQLFVGGVLAEWKRLGRISAVKPFQNHYGGYRNTWRAYSFQRGVHSRHQGRHHLDDGGLRHCEGNAVASEIGQVQRGSCHCKDIHNQSALKKRKTLNRQFVIVCAVGYRKIRMNLYLWIVYYRTILMKKQKLSYKYF